MSLFDGYKPTWCPGCGNYAILASIKRSLDELGLKPSDVFTVFGIGCSGNMNDFLNVNVFHGLHGRSLPAAIGIKIASHNMPVLVIAGDGDFYGEGGNHFLHACRGNHDITVIIHNNNVYGLTTGQVAPTAKKGYKSKSTPSGIIEEEINPLALAISQGATYVAQGYAKDVLGLSSLIKDGINHKGFSLINVLQPCVTFNKTHSYEFFDKNSYKLPESYDSADFDKAIKKSFDPIKNGKYPVGVLYKTKRSIFTENLSQIKSKNLSEKNPDKETIIRDLHEIATDFI